MTTAAQPAKISRQKISAILTRSFKQLKQTHPPQMKILVILVPP